MRRIGRARDWLAFQGLRWLAPWVLRLTGWSMGLTSANEAQLAAHAMRWGLAVKRPTVQPAEAAARVRQLFQAVLDARLIAR